MQCVSTPAAVRTGKPSLDRLATSSSASASVSGMLAKITQIDMLFIVSDVPTALLPLAAESLLSFSALSEELEDLERTPETGFTVSGVSGAPRIVVAKPLLVFLFLFISTQHPVVK
eukprot:1614664-Amphidinium_carterae.1